MKVTVVIPTYYDNKRLNMCLHALDNQTLPKKDFEVIVINNARHNDSLDIIPNSLNLKIFHETKSGSYAARNRGIKYSETEIIAFTDSDCIPYQDWLEQALKVLETGAQRVAGKIELFYKSERLTVVEIFQKAFAFNQRKYVSDGWSVTANMVTWKKNFDKAGLFNESMKSGGDTEWGVRASALGIDLVYSPKVIVKHPARHQINQLVTKMKRVSGGVVQMMGFNEKVRLIYLFPLRFLPPLMGSKELYNRSDLTVREKLICFSIMYYLKVFTNLYRLALILGISKTERS